MLRVNAFENASNVSTYTVKKDGVDFDLSAAGIVRVEIVDEGFTMDSTSEFVTLSGSTLTIEWGAFSAAPGQLSPTIYAYRAGDTKGEVLYGPGQSPIHLDLHPDERPAS